MYTYLYGSLQFCLGQLVHRGEPPIHTGFLAVTSGRCYCMLKILLMKPSAFPSLPRLHFVISKAILM